MKRYLILMVLSLAALALQSPQPIPPCKGPECIDDYTGEKHEGMPKFCQNYDTPDWKANCKCERNCDEHFATGCVRHCMVKGCLCRHGCDSR